MRSSGHQGCHAGRLRPTRCGSSFMRWPTISAISCARWRGTPEPIKNWSLTSLKEKLIKIGARGVDHGRYVAFQMAKGGVVLDCCLVLGLA